MKPIPNMNECMVLWWPFPALESLTSSPAQVIGKSEKGLN
jgi:hypothetical protein